mgnify:CR=1 FL=1
MHLTSRLAALATALAMTGCAATAQAPASAAAVPPTSTAAPAAPADQALLAAATAMQPAVVRTLERLVNLAGRGFRAMMVATAEAAARGELRCEFDLGGHCFASVARPYTARCWTWLKVMFADLSEADRSALRPMLEAAGFWDVLRLSPGEAEQASKMEKF